MTIIRGGDTGNLPFYVYICNVMLLSDEFYKKRVKLLMRATLKQFEIAGYEDITLEFLRENPDWRESHTITGVEKIELEAWFIKQADQFLGLKRALGRSEFNRFFDKFGIKVTKTKKHE